MIKKKLISWYLQNKRDLPWRNTSDAYKIWLSEVILQQTRVDQGRAYYLKFIENFPTIADLANANEDEVLNLWQGLGYYSRARNLHYTAKHIKDQHNGVFPKEYENILSLKGVGEYTAAAIASFAYNKAYSVIDGNVFRVLSRIFGIDTPIDSTQGKKLFKELAQNQLDHKNPGVYNQAIMEFGATFCKPNNPNCNDCIFTLQCIAHKKGLIDVLPVKSKKLKIRNRYFNYLVLHNNSELVLKKRETKDIWTGLYDFPLVETNSSEEPEQILSTSFIQETKSKFKIASLTELPKHILSHQVIYSKFIELQFKGTLPKLPKGYKKITFSKLHKYPVPRLIQRYIEHKKW